MEKSLIEKYIKETIERIKSEISEDKKVICDWHSSYANISVIKKNNEERDYILFNANVYDNGEYSLGHIYDNYDYILNDYFTNVENYIDYHEFKELLNLDKNFIFFDKDDYEIDYYFGLEREFELKLEKEAIELTIHKESITYSLHKDPKGNEWNLTTLVENQPSSDTRGNYKDCFDELLREVKYADLFIELVRQDKMININNTNENGAKEGLWVIPKENEHIKEEICFFENDKLNGKFAEIFKNNEISEIGTYKENIKKGKVFSYYGDTLNLKESKNYENGILNGKYKNFLYTGELSCEGNMKNGNFDGLFKTYFTNKEGKLFLWQIKNFENGKEQGEVINFFPNGNIETKFNMEDGFLHGSNIEYHENGQIKEISNYNSNSLHGEYKKFDSFGRLEKECSYNYGKMERNCKEYYLGKLVSDREYKNDMLNGEAKEYSLYTDGTSSYCKGYYVNDEKQGIWTEYDKDGILHSTQNYTDNRENGIYKQFDKEGKITYTEEWEYGEKLNEIEYYPNGQIQSIEQWCNGVKNGVAEFFYESGELKEKYNYKDGELDGPVLTYDKKGNIIKEDVYKRGEKSVSVKKEIEKNDKEKEEKEEKPTNPWAKKLKNDKESELER